MVLIIDVCSSNNFSLIDVFVISFYFLQNPIGGLFITAQQTRSSFYKDPDSFLSSVPRFKNERIMESYSLFLFFVFLHNCFGDLPTQSLKNKSRISFFVMFSFHRYSPGLSSGLEIPQTCPTQFFAFKILFSSSR